MATPEEPIEQEDDGAPQGPVSTVYRPRRYTDDRSFPKLKQWFAPLPSKHGVQPLDQTELCTHRSTVKVGNAAQLLEEAKTVWDGRIERIRATEAKATTLLGTVAIAASLVVAGSGLVLDPSRVASGWRAVLMIIVLLLLVSLLLCGFVASRALLKVQRFSRPQVSQALQRATEDPSRAQTSRALDLIARAGRNLYVADYKVAQVRIAYRWYRLALLCFLLLGSALAAYVLFGHPPK